MNKKLFRRFLFGYFLLGIAALVLTIGLGSYLVEQGLEHSISGSLYREANAIASNGTIRYDITVENLDAMRSNLSAVASFQDSVIWIMNSEGKIVLSTRTDIAPDTPIDVKNFDPVTWGSNYYQVGDFYGYFPDKRISIIAPITDNMAIKGYISIHYPMSTLYERRSNILEVILILFAIFYVLTFSLFLIYIHYVDRPLHAVAKGAEEFAHGNFTHRIPVNSHDELGYLANTLNFMAGRINATGEYQRNFISNVSHDFRSPLTSIKGYVEAMLDGTIPPEMQERYLKIIAYESGRLEKLTRSLLTLNELDIQKRSLHMQRFDINDMIKTTAITFEGICTERKIRMELMLSGRELFARADVDQIEQVLHNLLDNAVKFSANDSTITIDTSEKNDKIFVSVKDRGLGIPKGSLSKIWNRFYKIDTSRGKDQQGTGLGLSIVKEIIHAHGQNIDVISTEGVGTEFIFTLEKAK